MTKEEEKLKTESGPLEMKGPLVELNSKFLTVLILFLWAKVLQLQTNTQFKLDLPPLKQNFN